MSSFEATIHFDTADEVRRYVNARLSSFEPTGTPQRLPGGNLNVVWRVPGTGRSLIVKYAPPYIATDPDTPLDPSRLLIEARCLTALSPHGGLADPTESAVRAPRPVDVNEEIPVLIMEDVGEGPSLDAWLRAAEGQSRVTEAAEQGRRLGSFIGQLHATTCNDDRYVETFDNRPMQETRLAVQYRGVTEMLRTGGVEDAEALGTRAESLGEKLLEPGRCLTMGDLWPPSVLVVEDGLRPDRREEVVSGLRLIDWELAHYGRPLQDVAHWCAHLWMQRHCAPSDAVEEAATAHRTAFLTAYNDALGNAEAALWNDAERRDAAIHFGAEILMRAVGPFQEGYVYAGLAPDHPVVQEAVSMATEHLRSPRDADIPITALGQ